MYGYLFLNNASLPLLRAAASIIGEFLNVDRESVLPDDNGVRFNLLKN